MIAIIELDIKNLRDQQVNWILDLDVNGNFF